MKPIRRFRLLAALYALISVLFMQFAVAAHACSVGEGIGAERHQASATDHESCQMPEQGQSNLCKSHCERAAQSIDGSPQPAFQAPVLPLLASVALLDTHRPLSNPRDSFSASVPEPPPTLRFCVLRI